MLFYFIFPAAVLESPEMIREGFLWFSNMLVADPTWILPLVVTALQLFNSEVSQKMWADVVS